MGRISNCARERFACKQIAEGYLNLALLTWVADSDYDLTRNDTVAAITVSISVELHWTKTIAFGYPHGFQSRQDR